MSAPSNWPHLPSLPGTKGYARTPLGQVHYRDHGASDGKNPPVLLLHQTPWFSVQYLRVQPLLAAAGFRTIAPDTPGYGMSDLPAQVPSIEDYADNLVAVLDHLGLQAVAVAGHHTGALIAAALAHRHPQRTRALVLHGLPFYTAEERASRLAQPHWAQAPKEGGAHLSDRFKMLGERIAPKGATLEGIHWSVMSFFLAGPTEWYGHHAAYTYDAGPAVADIKAPTLLISNTDDTIHHMAARISKLRPDFAYQERPGTAHAVTDRPDEWVASVAPFLRAVTSA